MSSGVYNQQTGYHNRRSIRLRGYDYSQPGYYFVTVCIHNRHQRLFGEFFKNRMMMNEFGKCVEQCWHSIPAHFPYAKTDEFVVMPNHVHGVIQIFRRVDSVGANNYSPLQPNQQPPQIPRPRGTSKTIGSIIRGFKIGVTKYVHQTMQGMVVWQRNYYEHIIRDESSLFFIRKYIRENPFNWADDSENHIDREIEDFKMIERGEIK